MEIVYATGAVEPVRWAKVASLIRDRIVDLCHCEGKTVAKGDVLVRLDDREVRAQLQELKAREEFAKREMARVTELLGRGVATTQAFERISTDLRQIQALISVQMEKLDDYTITAPMDGVVLRRDGEIGEIAEPGQILFRVGVPKPLQVVAEVNEEDIPRVAVGQTVLLRTDAFAGPAPRGQGARDHAHGRRRGQDLPHPHRAPRRYAAARRHERGGQRGDAREDRRAADPRRCRAGLAGAGRRPATACGAGRSRSASAAPAPSRWSPASSEDERVASPAPADLADGSRVRVRASDRSGRGKP